MGNLAIPYHESLINLCFQLVVQPRLLISRDAASHRAFNCGQAKTGQSVTSTRRATPKHGSPSPNSRAHTKVWESMVKMSKKM